MNNKNNKNGIRNTFSHDANNNGIGNVTTI